MLPSGVPSVAICLHSEALVRVGEINDRKEPSLRPNLVLEDGFRQTRRLMSLRSLVSKTLWGTDGARPRAGEPAHRGHPGPPTTAPFTELSSQAGRRNDSSPYRIV